MKKSKPHTRLALQSAPGETRQAITRRFPGDKRKTTPDTALIDRQREVISVGINALRAMCDPAIIEAASPQTGESLAAGARIILDSMAEAADSIERTTLSLNQRRAG
ncbi:MAG: hypothetical protein KDI33_00190 [Halioglobus sp.]|nr:hypothetical protein [Halioglobus sp.]